MTKGAGMEHLFRLKIHLETGSQRRKFMLRNTYTGPLGPLCVHSCSTFSNSRSQSTYRGRVEMGCPLSWSVCQNVVRDGRYSPRGCTTAPTTHQAGLIFHHIGCTPDSGRCHSVCTVCSMPWFIGAI
jgi:hypothetical protein